ncbi:putative nucleotidyltransferase substrate binding domain-containing protein [Dethiosulfatarculus sandiegensis]|uniref:Nucleotidyltransferase n=1 Tax=Dethiosulfatarculus sandiegensis TaxID=1429043 RepID=A0A0D2GE36_9BACT|nr:putative nucleotidyltransferase substrate binding domain-containing protein [Dethiosulfatarculus sandiegensis]KIX13257.1 hypothetical protein X474_14740 [Dethiosulfatarculus sandiegensis]
MTDFPLERVLAFVATVTPFDALDREALEEVVSQMEIAFYPKGEVIIPMGGPPSSFLHIIQSGSARITLPGDEGEILVDVRGEGDSFGALSLLQGKKALFEVSAREDLICYLLPAFNFKRLVEENQVFERHFAFSLARNLEAVRKGKDNQLPQVTGLGGLYLEAALVRSRVGELMSRQVLSCLPATSIRTTARRMTQAQVGAMVIKEESGVPVGIVTDRDLRTKVLTRGMDYGASVYHVMSQPLHTITPDKFAFEALLQMSRHGVHHLVVTDNERVVGVLSDHDLQTLTGSSPVAVARDIDKITKLDDLVRQHERVDRILEMLLRQGGSAQTMLELVTEFNDRVVRKLIHIIENQMEASGLGSPPVRYVWMALGSEGRREQTLRTDQDNSIIFANVPPEKHDQIQGWFLEFGEQVVAGLERCGIPRCKGGVMASNPKCCQTEERWIKTFISWVREPNPKTLRLASIFFDFRGIMVEADFLDNLAAKLGRAMDANRLFLRFMAKNGLYNRPPLGFFRQFVVEKSGEHKNKLNLKLSGLTPLVDAARVLSLEQGIKETNTLFRLRELAQRGILKGDFAADLEEAFCFITLLRITRHLEDRAHGKEPDNFLNPAGLNKLQRSMLKESFTVINRLQDLLEHRFQTWLVT